MSFLRVVALVVGVLCLPVTATAVTMRDVIELTKAGLSDDIIVAVIEADRTIFTLDKTQILELKRAGVSHAVILRMLRTRRDFDVPPVPEPAPVPTTQASPDAQSPTPGLVVIGGGKPEPAPVVLQQYYYVPVPIWGTHVPRGPRPVPQPFLAQPYRGFGRFINDGWVERR